MSFNIGDKVIVCSEEFPEQNGLTADIFEIRELKRLQCRVRYDGNQNAHPYFSARTRDTNGLTNSYSYEDLKLLSGARQSMPDPMFDLDDMEIAEMIMDEMK